MYIQTRMQESFKQSLRQRCLFRRNVAILNVCTLFLHASVILIRAEWKIFAQREIRVKLSSMGAPFKLQLSLEVFYNSLGAVCFFASHTSLHKAPWAWIQMIGSSAFLSSYLTPDAKR